MGSSSVMNEMLAPEHRLSKVLYKVVLVYTSVDALFGYKVFRTHSALGVSFVVDHLISNARSCNNCYLLHYTHTV